MVAIRVLGPLEVHIADRPIRLGGPRERKLLAALALDPGRVVPAARLVDVLWESSPPATAGQQINNCVAKLRRSLAEGGLAPELVRFDSHGYRLCVAGDAVDATRFAAMVAEARAHTADGRLVQAASLYRRALGLWRGEALSGLDCPALRGAAAGLDEQRLIALEELADARLGLGEHGEIIADLTIWVNNHRVRERLAGQLMVALYRCGRAAEALECYRRTRDFLVAEYGTEPGPRLQEMQLAMLRGDPALAQPDTHPRPPANEITPPGGGAPLPRRAGHFVGRRDELFRLRSAAAEAPPPVIVLFGLPGAGKTTLAVEAMHHFEPLFAERLLLQPGTQDPMVGVLRLLGIPESGIPAGVAERAALYQSALAGRKVLLVLDDARSPAQVSPLIPAEPGPMLIVTSRARMAVLAVEHDVVYLPVGPLAPQDSLELLSRSAGRPAVDADPQAAAEITELCGHLPLALRIVGARLATRESLTVKQLCHELARPARLDAIALSGEDFGLESVFESAVRDLDPLTRKVFGGLGGHPGRIVTAELAAASADVPVAEARLALDRLAAGSLLIEADPGAYIFHDLVRDYAIRCAPKDSERILDWFLATALACAELVSPYRERIVPTLSHPEVAGCVPDAGQPAAALDYLSRLAADLPAVVRDAAERGRDEAAWQLVFLLEPFFLARSRGHLATACASWGLKAARRGGDLRAQAHMYNTAGIAAGLTLRREAAIRYQEKQRRLWHRLGDPVGQQRALNNLGISYQWSGRLEEAIDAYQRSLALADANYDPTRAALAMVNLASAHRVKGGPAEGARYAQRAAGLARRINDRNALGQAHTEEGLAHAALGDTTRALKHLDQALVLQQELGDLRMAALTARQAGSLRMKHGDAATGMAQLREALRTYRETQDGHGESMALVALGSAQTMLGDLAGARASLEAAHQLRRARPSRLEEGRLEHRLGDLAARAGDLEAAHRHWAAAREAYEDVGSVEAGTLLAELAVTAP
ncbi:MAG TPA: BTAD domain-containing putative transcriptional regulator [Candidatus Limnocylindrales bacterium]|nr:BTAD domain-containing putative transcriptional regulator [Candidatus Limnocylindrales bacterium]